MSLSQLFRTPFVRVPFLAFAVFSSVATSEPESGGWSVQSSPSSLQRTLGAAGTVGAKVDRSFSYVSSGEDPQAFLTLTDFDGSAAELRLTVDGCAADQTFVRTYEDGWYTTVDSVRTTVAYPSLTPDCQSASGTLTLHYENLASAPVSFTEGLTMQVSGGGPNPPTTAFVDVSPVQ